MEIIQNISPLESMEPSEEFAHAFLCWTLAEPWIKIAAKKEIILDGSDYEGNKLPESLLSALSYLPRMRKLTLKNSNLYSSDLKILTKLTELTEFDISSCLFQEDISGNILTKYVRTNKNLKIVTVNFIDIQKKYPNIFEGLDKIDTVIVLFEDLPDNIPDEKMGKVKDGVVKINYNYIETIFPRIFEGLESLERMVISLNVTRKLFQQIRV